MNDDRVLPGIALMLGFCATAPLIDAASKLAAQSLPVGQITAVRFAVQAALMAPICLALGHSLRLPRGTGGATIGRALCLIASTYCFVAALVVMPIADALAIVFVEPFLLLILGNLIYGDQIGPRRIAASAVGFAGSLLVIQPSFAVFGAVALFPLGTALFFALYMLITRGLSRRLHPIAMQYHTASIATLICLPIIVLSLGRDWPTLSPVWPEGLAWVWLAGVGAASAVAHLLMTYALRLAPTATLAPLHYLEMVTAVALGYAIFGDFPNLLTWAGIAVIVASGLYVIARERATARAPATVAIATGATPP